LVKVRLRSRLAVQLLNVVCASVEQVAVVRLLVARCEAPKDENVLVRYLVKAATLQADPVRVLLYAEIQRFPMLPSLNIVLFNQVGPLPAIEARDDEERLVVKGDCGMEVASCV